MMHIINSPNDLEDFNILEYYHKDIAKKLPKNVYNIFFTERKSMEKKVSMANTNKYNLILTYLKTKLKEVRLVPSH